MNENISEKLVFDIGWKATIFLELFSRDYLVKLKFKAYFEKDKITQEQEKAYIEYKENKKIILNKVEKLLLGYSLDAATRFIPKTLLFERDGAYALLCDDTFSPDEGVAVTLAPKKQVILQDEYL